jgi:hypothetical protein
MFCALGIVFGDAECVGSHFQVLPSRTHFRRYRGRRVPFSRFARPNPFLTVPRASGPIFLFCAPDSFSAVPRASGPVFMFCASGLIFGDNESVRYRFHVLRFRARFRKCRVRRIPFSCFALPDSFSAVPRASGHVFLFYAPRLIFGSIDGVGSHFHVLPARTRFRRYRGRRVPFSCLALPDLFSKVPRASGPVFMFCAPGLVFDGIEGVGSRFHVLRSRNRFRRCRRRRIPFSSFAAPDSFSAVRKESDPIFMFCAPGIVFGGAGGVGSCFHVLCSRTRFRRCRVSRVPFSCFAISDSFSAVPRASDPVFGRTEGIGSRFRPYRGRRVPISCFARPDLFLTIPRASGPVFIFHAPGIVFAEGVWSRFHVLHALTYFRPYRGRWVPFPCFARPNLFLALPRAAGPVFMFYAAGIVFGAA